MKYPKEIPSTLQRLSTLIARMGYECEIITPGELFVFTVKITTENGEPIDIYINVTENGENHLIGEGNYIALETFIPCGPIAQEEELLLCNYIMKLIMQVDLTTIQYVHASQQVLISRVDCITPDIPDNHIIDHILQPTINEFKHIFTLIENTPLNTHEDETQQTDTPLDNTPGNKYLN